MSIDIAGQTLILKDPRKVYEGNTGIGFLDFRCWKFTGHELVFPWSYGAEDLTENYFLTSIDLASPHVVLKDTASCRKNYHCKSVMGRFWIVQPAQHLAQQLASGVKPLLSPF